MGFKAAWKDLKDKPIVMKFAVEEPIAKKKCDEDGEFDKFFVAGPEGKGVVVAEGQKSLGSVGLKGKKFRGEKAKLKEHYYDNYQVVKIGADDCASMSLADFK